jgi:hypothetical protein
MASGYLFLVSLVFLLCIILNSSYLDAYSVDAFNPPVFSKQPGDIRSEANYQNWNGPTKAVFPPSNDSPTSQYGSSLVLPCVATNTKTYTWYRNGFEFNPEASDSSFEFVNKTMYGSLLVKRWKIADEGTYQCAASNDGGQIFSSSYSFRSLVVSKSFEGFKAPSKQTISHPMNQDFFIDCFEETRKLCGLSQSCVKPSHLNVYFSPGESNFLDIPQAVPGKYTYLDEKNGKLYFYSYPENSQTPTPLDGNYECRLTPEGDAKTIIINSKHLSFISNPSASEPSLIYPPAAQGRIITVKESIDSSVNFICVFKGFPTPDVTYEADSEIRFHPLSFGISFFPNKSMHDKKIRCTAKAPGYSPKVEEFTLNVEYPPTANMTMRVLPFIRGSDNAAHILCDVPPVNPKPAVTFYFKDKLISDARKSFDQVGTQGRHRLAISNPVADDAGVYVCNATNSQGSSFSATRLVIIEPTVVSLYYWNEAQTEQNKTLLTTSTATKPMEIYKTNGSVFIKCEISSLDSQNYLINANGAANVLVCTSFC